MIRDSIPITLVPAGTVVTANGVVGSVVGPFANPGLVNVVVQVNVTAVSGTTPTSTFTLQTSYDGGLTWVDLVTTPAFTAVGRAVLSLSIDVGGATPFSATDGTQAAAGVNSGMLGDRIRIKASNVGGTSPSFTLGVQGFLRG